MHDVLTVGAFLLKGLLKLLMQPIIWALGGKAKKQQPRRPIQSEVRAAIRFDAPAASAGELCETGPITILQANPFEVADRIVTIRLDPPVGVINMRLFREKRSVTRDLIINEPRLRAMMRGRRHSLTDVTYDPVEGIERIKNETVKEVEKLINDLGSLAVREAKPPQRQKQPDKVPQPQPKAPPRAVESQGHEAASAPAEGTNHQRVFIAQAREGFTYVGKLKYAAPRTVTPHGRSPYEVFEAILELDNGAELPLRGLELERELLASKCQVGDKVAITPMGKVPVPLGDGGEGKKNLYRVKNMTAQGRN